MSVNDVDVEIEDGCLVVATPGFSDLSLTLPEGFEEDKLRCQFDKAQHKLIIKVPAPEPAKAPRADPRIAPKEEPASPKKPAEDDKAPAPPADVVAPADVPVAAAAQKKPVQAQQTKTPAAPKAAAGPAQLDQASVPL